MYKDIMIIISDDLRNSEDHDQTHVLTIKQEHVKRLIEYARQLQHAGKIENDLQDM